MQPLKQLNETTSKDRRSKDRHIAISPYKSINQSINQSINRSINQSNRSINIPHKESTSEQIDSILKNGDTTETPTLKQQF